MAKFNPTIDPSFDPANFKKKNGTSYAINNDYLIYSPGTVYNYVATDPSGDITETRTVTVTNQTIQISGVTCNVVRDEVWDAEGNRIETALDYFAQDKDGNVWYFGEDVVNYNYD